MYDQPFAEPTHVSPFAEPSNVRKMALWSVPLGLILLLVVGGIVFRWYQRSDAANPLETVGLDFGSIKKLNEVAQYSPIQERPEPPKKMEWPSFLPPTGTPAAIPAPSPAPVAPRPRRRPQAQLVVLTSNAPTKPLLRGPLYTLPGWTYIPATLENVVISEVAGFFTVVTKRPMPDATRQHTLIPHGQRIGGKALSEYLLFGNERIPTAAVSMTVGGEDIDLGKCVIMDESGTMGLTGIVDNHVWRIVWTSILIEGLYAGQQVLQHQMTNTGDSDSVNISGVGQYSSNLARQRLGRAQDTRPTIEISAGQGCQVLCPHALKLPAL